MVDERGVISGGKLIQSSVGILGRKREIKELTAESTGLQSRAENLQQKLEEVSVEIRVKKDTLQKLIDAKWRCQEEVNELDNILFRLGQEMDQSEKLLQKIREDLEQKGTEQDRHHLELQRIQEELQQCHIQRKQVEAYFQEKEKELRESEEEFDQLREEFTKLQSDARILEEERRGLLREIERLDEYSEESDQRRQRIEEDIAAGKEKRISCDTKRGEIRSHLEGLYERLKESEDDLNTADRSRHEYQEKIRAEEDKAGELRSEIGDLKEKINAARMEHSEIRFKMNNLEAMTRDKFNLNLPDIHEQYLAEDFSVSQVEEELEHKRTLRQRLGEVNLTAIKEHEALQERHDFIQKQREDLISSIESLRAAIRKINRTSLEKFRETLGEVDQKLKVIFPILFNGGTAGLKLTDEEKPLESGVLVWVQPPGKKLSHMGLLSGGEKALVAMAFLFAIYLIKPSPFCLLDEVDAPLDEANINRFNELLREIQKSSQIIMVTHNRRTMEIVDRLYGVTMEKPGISKTVAVDIENIRETAGADSETPHAAVN
jgi:chromosome segregation protein